jgi:dipeptidyl aminopeptidase/acylaminoacyl peptidase
MRKNTLLITFSLLLTVCLGIFILIKDNTENNNFTTQSQDNNEQDMGGPEYNINPLSIQNLRNGDYPGSDIIIEQTLTPGSNYQRYIASYKSEGLKIYALLTVPNARKPESGWPVIIFNHGYIPPTQYVTTERYIAYTDAFSKNGYIVLRSDYRGHGNSEGKAEGGYGSSAYTIDILNAISSIKKYKDVNPTKIGMWGHSMGGYITLRSMVINKDIKAGVIWAGVVASYPDLLSKWRRGTTPLNLTPSPFPTTSSKGGWRQGFISQFGTPEENPSFWNSISANSYLKDISGPLQLHHGTSDNSVPHEFSEILEKQMKKENKEVQLYIYQGDDHNITSNFNIAMKRSVEFFDKYLK